MTSFDPNAVRAFVAGVDTARTHAAEALDAVARIRSGEGNVADLFHAQATTELMAGALMEARGSATTFPAADAARRLSVDGSRDVRVALWDLEAAISAAGGSTDSAEVVARASTVHARLNRLANFEIEEVALRASAPKAGDDLTLGAIDGAGEWRTFDAAVNDALDGARATIDDEARALFAQLDDIEGPGRAIDVDVLDDLDRWDAEIALDQLHRTDDVVGAITSTRGSTAAGIEGRVADGVFDDFVTAGRPITYAAPIPFSGVDAPLARAIEPGEHVMSLRFQHAEFDRPAEMRLVATEHRYQARSSEEAIQMALADPTDSTWAVLPREDGMFELVSLGAAVDGFDDAASAARRLDADMTGHAPLASIAAYVHGGKVSRGVAPSSSIESSVDAWARELQALEQAGATRSTPLATVGGAAPLQAGTPLARLESAKRRFGSSSSATASIATHQAHRVIGTRSDALRAMDLLLAAAGKRTGAAAVKLAPGEYGIYRLDLGDLSARARKAITNRVTGTTLAEPLTPGLEAIALRGDRRVTLVDAVSGELVDRASLGR